MFRDSVLTICLLLGFLPAIGHPDEITLPRATCAPPFVIGKTHVFADRNQTIQLNLPGEEAINAQLYRTAGNTAAPAGEPIRITPVKNKPTPIRIDFPRSNKPTQYLLIFDSPDKPRLKITALPLEHLHYLRRVTGKEPITLVNPPQDLGETFRQLGIGSRIQNTPSPRKSGILVFFRKQISEPTPEQVKRAKRLIIVNPTCSPHQEVWISTKPDTWRITVPRHYFNPDLLLTANGQATLIHTLLDVPSNL